MRQISAAMAQENDEDSAHSLAAFYLVSRLKSSPNSKHLAHTFSRADSVFRGLTGHIGITTWRCRGSITGKVTLHPVVSYVLP